MSKAKPTAVRVFRRERPDLVVRYLRYALEDVRPLSHRGAMLLEAAIKALEEELGVMSVAHDDPPNRSLS